MSNHIKDDTYWHNQPQSNAMTSAAFIFIAGGMELALGLGWNINTFILTTRHFQFCWFIGAMAGAILAAPLIPYLPKRFYFALSSLLLLATGIIFVSAPYNYEAILAARYVSGIAIGFSTIAFIIHGSEVGAPSYRGAVLSLEQYAITFGIAIQVTYASQWTSDINFAANRLHGIFIISFALIALGSILLVIESPVFHMRKGNEIAALECLRALERPHVAINFTKSTKQTLEELKSYVMQEKNLSFAKSMQRSFLPLVKVLLFRSIIPFTFSLPLNGAIELASYVSIGHTYNWPPVAYIELRVVGAFISLWLIDRWGRKWIPLFSLLCIAGLTIAIGVQFDPYNSQVMSTICILLLIGQFFAGIFIPSSSVYLGEAFSVAWKPYMAAFCVCAQQVIHIVTILTYVFSTYNAYVYFITVGCTMFAFCLYFCLTIPETRNTTLREAQSRFRKLLYLKLS